MAKLKLKQILSNLSYNPNTDQLILSSSGEPSFIISGSVMITSTPTQTGSLTIKDIDNFGDSGSFDSLDLGDY